MKYEYKSVFIQSMTASDLTKELNKYGKNAWELVSILNQGASLLAVFKREYVENI